MIRAALKTLFVLVCTIAAGPAFGCPRCQESAEQMVEREQAEIPKTSTKVCGHFIVARSSSAVGQPCETSASFAAKLGLSQAKLAKIERFKAGI